MAFPGQAATEKQAREVTLNERLNKAVDLIAFQCERLENVLSRVNGTPQATGNKLGDVQQIRPTHAMAQVVEMIEAVQAKLADLATGVERIA